MQNSKVERMNDLFEKMLSEKANTIEKTELDQLYQEFINDGRDDFQIKTNSRQRTRAIVS